MDCDLQAYSAAIVFFFVCPRLRTHAPQPRNGAIELDELPDRIATSLAREPEAGWRRAVELSLASTYAALAAVSGSDDMRERVAGHA